MQIHVHPMLAAHRAVLDLPPGERREVILRMLTPFAPVLRIMTPPGADPITLFGFMRPDGPAAACTDALARASAATGYHPPIDTIHFGLFLLETNPQMVQLSQGYTALYTEANGTDIYRALAELFVQDERSAANYEKIKPGMARFMRAAMHAPLPCPDPGRRSQESGRPPVPRPTGLFYLKSEKRDIIGPDWLRSQTACLVVADLHEGPCPW